MPKELKPGWVYVNKDNPIGLKYAIHKETGWVYFEDGVKYSPEEIKILIESGNPVSKSLHTVKKVFQGEIIRYEQGTNDKGKSDESGGGKNTNKNTPSKGNISKNQETGPGLEYGELDIY
jgi:hypothetical protein